MSFFWQTMMILSASADCLPYLSGHEPDALSVSVSLYFEDIMHYGKQLPLNIQNCLAEFELKTEWG